MKSLPGTLILVLLGCTLSTTVKIGVSKTNTYNHTATTADTHDITEAPTPTLTTNDEVSSHASTPATTLTTRRSLPTFPPKKIQPSIKRASTTPTPLSTSSTVSSSIGTESNLSEAAPFKNASYQPAEQTTYEYTPYNYCACNLQTSICDINCCCDPDCTPTVLKVFNCDAPPVHSELLTRLEDFEYTHGLPSCKINDGWLCVFRTNVKHVKEQISFAHLDTSAYHKWQQELYTETTQAAATHDADYYKYGEPLLFLNPATLELTNFELLTSFKPPYCQILEPIRHLKPLSSSCLIESSDLLQEQLYALLNYTQSVRVLRTPKLASAELAQESEQLAPLRVCRRISPSAAAQPCTFLATYSNVTEFTDDLLSDGYVTDVEIQVLHNYTHIQGLLIVLNLRLIADENAALWQAFSVDFVYQKESAGELTTVPQTKQQKPISGPLGYVQGEAIIMATAPAALNGVESGDAKSWLSYFQHNASADAASYMLALFTRAGDGSCYKPYGKANAINYGVSTSKQCNLRVLSFNAAGLSNYTAYCKHVQASILTQLLPHNVSELTQLSSIFVSQLGKPVPAHDKWLQLSLRHYDYAPITADYNAQAQTFTCRNVILSGAYEFHIAKRSLYGLKHQRLVQHAAYKAGQRHDLEFELHEQLELPLTLSVMFYDVSSNRMRNGVQHLGGSFVLQLINAAFIVKCCFFYKGVAVA